MKLFLFDVKDLMSGSQYILQPGDVGIGVHLKEDNQTISTEPGVPEHRIISTKGVVTFGVPRLLKQDQRNASCSLASQVYHFITQNPDWYPNYVYRPVFDVTIDDAVALALMSKQYREKMLLAGTKLLALLAELNEWTANKYNFVKTGKLRLLNYYLRLHQYPFYDYPGPSRTELCEITLKDLMAAIVEELDSLEPIKRVYPEDLKFEVLHTTDKVTMVSVKTDRHGAEDLIAQEVFEANPSLVRVCAIKKIKNTTKHFVVVYNSNIYDANLKPFAYVNAKELNTLEKKSGGIAEWKNLKLTTLGPRKGSLLTTDIIWENVKTV